MDRTEKSMVEKSMVVLVVGLVTLVASQYGAFGTREIRTIDNFNFKGNQVKVRKKTCVLEEIKFIFG